MTPAELLTDALERVRDSALATVAGLDDDTLARPPAPGANTIAWLVWHLARVQDSHVAEAAGHEQVWTAQCYVDRFGLALDPADTGYRHAAQQVAAVRASAADLTAYVGAVHARSVAWLAGLSPDDLDRVVDEGWDPPVTLGVRLVSVIDDDLAHAGQAAYVRGLLGA